MSEASKLTHAIIARIHKHVQLYDYMGGQNNRGVLAKIQPHIEVVLSEHFDPPSAKKWRAYTALEYIELMNKFDPDEYMIFKPTGEPRYIDHLRLDRIGLTTYFKDVAKSYSVHEMFDLYKRKDGTPCGVCEE